METFSIWSHNDTPDKNDLPLGFASVPMSGQDVVPASPETLLILDGCASQVFLVLRLYVLAYLQDFDLSATLLLHLAILFPLLGFCAYPF